MFEQVVEFSDAYLVAKTSCEENKVIDQNRSYEQESVERASVYTEWILSRLSAYRRLLVKDMPGKTMRTDIYENI
ncbi:hypothetical protein DRW31_23225 [Shigella dysenteriae]|uniref:Uncharacterized protein n=1 Tax=Shigella dysenteriae TaxID=622 RepID=A0A403M8L8_SHIDY|nr:hypothetical protein [Shigella dysenteriae]EGE2519878.1 hypothetical protein [Shigella dysenteriae]MLU15080.1 hypothetical protein [Shigella dysenteriae]